jgi:hypothetical protein
MKLNLFTTLEDKIADRIIRRRWEQSPAGRIQKGLASAPSRVKNGVATWFARHKQALLTVGFIIVVLATAVLTRMLWRTGWLRKVFASVLNTGSKLAGFIAGAITRQPTTPVIVVNVVPPLNRRIKKPASPVTETVS